MTCEQSARETVEISVFNSLMVGEAGSRDVESTEELDFGHFGTEGFTG